MQEASVAPFPARDDVVVINGRFAFFLAALLLSLSATACATVQRRHCESVAAKLSGDDAGTAKRARDILDHVAQRGSVEDPCATEAALGVVERMRLADDLSAVRAIAAFETVTDQDVAAHALQVLHALDDPQTIAIARRQLAAGTTGVAGSATIVLTFRSDWESTNAVGRRLLAESEPRKHYSLVWLTLEFLSKSPSIPVDACEVLRPAAIFDEASELERPSPAIMRILTLRSELRARYACSGGSACIIPHPCARPSQPSRFSL